MARIRFPRLAYNWISFLGGALAVVAGATIVVLLFISFSMEEHSNPYFGIFLYMVMPPILIGGLLLIPIGMFREWRRWKRSGEVPERIWPRIDFNRATHRNATVVFVIGTLLFAGISAVGSYRAYHFTESVTFCGTTCHQVMEPEHTTYQNSPHARVSCTECHVGPGADWFVKSKLSGTYQIYAVLADVYPRPIPTPIESLRPAAETCEQCHWPQKQFGATQRTFDHHLYDEDNTHWPVEMLLKTDATGPFDEPQPRIHWHIDATVEYIARDEKRQDIPWVRVTDPETGEVTVYQSESDPLSEEEIAAAEPRVMDCMDCHNRPSHIFDSPDQAIDERLADGWAGGDLPYFKRIAVEAIAEDYETAEEANEAIATAIRAAYEEDHPEILAERSAELEDAIATARDAYAQNIFPRMKADWSVYPSNIGHFDNPGCMRCHEGSHVSDAGAVVTHECSACHVILAQGPVEEIQMASLAEGQEFRHPEDIGEMWREVGCWECHQGTQP